MARTNVVDSATAQFFINVKDNDFLNHKNTSPDGYGYAVFGQVIEGMDVVHSIEKVKTGNRGISSRCAGAGGGDQFESQARKRKTDCEFELETVLRYLESALGCPDSFGIVFSDGR